MNKIKNIFWICALVFCSIAISSLNLAYAVDLSGADLTHADYETISGTYTNVGNLNKIFSRALRRSLQAWSSYTGLFLSKKRFESR